MIVAAGIKLSAAFIVPLLVAACVASAMAPIVDWLKRFRMPTHVAVAATIVFSLGVLVGFGALISVAASDLTTSIPRLEHSLSAAKLDLANWLSAHRLGRLVPMAVSIDPGRFSERIVAG